MIEVVAGMQNRMCSSKWLLTCVLIAVLQNHGVAGHMRKVRNA
jgi:hypothetical protein